MSGTGWGILAAVLIALAIMHDRRQKRRGSAVGAAPVIFVRTIPRGNYIARKVIVLLVLVGLGWFFWYVAGDALQRRLLMDTLGAWLVIGIGVVIFLAARGRKNRVQGTARPVLFVPVAGAPAKRGPGLLAQALIVIAVFIAILYFGDWFLKHAPQLPPVR